MPKVDEQLISNVCKRHNLMYSRAVGLWPAGGSSASTALSSAARMQAVYDDWIISGFHGQMDYLARHAGQKYHPEHLLPGAKSLIQVLMPYYRARSWNPLPAGRGRVARYAWGRDYHKVLKKRLTAVCRELAAAFPGEEFRAFVDSGPLDERYFARMASLGGIGRNGLLIHPRFGSWIFLGEILTSLTLEEDRPLGRSPDSGAEAFILAGAPDGPDGDDAPVGKGPLPRPGEVCPPTCMNCRRKCPTEALRADGRFDARRCISYLTIEYRGSIAPELRPLMGDRLFGCDTCQDVCPLNRHVPETEEEDFQRDIAGESLDLKSILALRTREQMVGWFAGSPIMRASVEQLLRNACIVAANTGALHLHRELEQLSAHPDAIVAEHAAWALRNI